MASSTAIQLTEVGGVGPTSNLTDAPTASGLNNRGGGGKNGSRTADEVLQASLVADSEVPDGGYGWVVVTSGLVLLWWSLGTTYAWGVMQSALVEKGLASPATLSFIGSLQAALISVLAIANSRTMRWLGVKWTAVAGAACMGLSQIISSFTVDNLGGLFFCCGVLMGVGVR